MTKDDINYTCVFYSTGTIPAWLLEERRHARTQSRGGEEGWAGRWSPRAVSHLGWNEWQKKRKKRKKAANSAPVSAILITAQHLTSELFPERAALHERSSSWEFFFFTKYDTRGLHLTMLLTKKKRRRCDEKTSCRTRHLMCYSVTVAHQRWPWVTTEGQ